MCQLAHPIFLLSPSFFKENYSHLAKNTRKSCEVFEKNVSLRQKIIEEWH